MSRLHGKPVVGLLAGVCTSSTSNLNRVADVPPISDVIS